MNGLTTVFEIAPGSNGIRADAFFRLAIGFVALLGGVLALFRAKQVKKLAVPAFMTAWSVVWLIAHIPLWRMGTTQSNRLLDIYHNGKSQIVEGIVDVSHTQPAHGHSSEPKGLGEYQGRCRQQRDDISVPISFGLSTPSLSGVVRSTARCMCSS